MAEKTLEARVCLKYDTYENWKSKNTVLKKGEVAQTYVSSTSTIDSTGKTLTASSSGTIPAGSVLIKVGDGENHYNNLPFVYAIPSEDTSYGVATSSTLGLVKSGADITVDSSGNVTVNDDSHNHVISNVDGLQTALNGKASTAHNQASNTINAMTDYSKPSSTSAISPSDTLNSAIGKLEAALDGVETLLASI